MNVASSAAVGHSCDGFCSNRERGQNFVRLFSELAAVAQSRIEPPRDFPNDLPRSFTPLEIWQQRELH
jgi:hypothetical protein